MNIAMQNMTESQKKKKLINKPSKLCPSIVKNLVV